MTNVGKAYVEIHAKTDKFEKELSDSVDDAVDKIQGDLDKATKSVDQSMTSFGTKFKSGIQKAVIPATIALAAVGAMAKKAVGQASDLGESINAVNVVFEEASSGILELSKNAATAYGLSQTEFNSMAVQFSSFATKIAGSGGDVVGTIETISARAADFASVMNLEVADAARIFQSGLAGETEPLKKFGIDLSEAATKAFAMANGIGDGSGQLTEQEKILARHGSLMQQTDKTQGDFANTSDNLANRQRILSAQFKDMQAQVGAALIPIFEKLAGVAQKVVYWMSENKNIVLGVGIAVGALAASVLVINTAYKVYLAYTKLAIGLQLAWNFALTANPIGLIVVGIGLLIGAIVLAYKKFDGFRMVVNKVTNLVIGYFEFMINAWIKAINFFVKGINKLTGIFRAIGIPIGELGEIGEVSLGRLSTATEAATEAAGALGNEQEFNAALALELAGATDTATTSTDDLTKSTGKASTAADKAAEKIKKLRDAMGDGFKTTIETANEVLNKARDAYSDFSKSVSEAVTQSFSFRDAYEAGEESGSGFFSALTDQATKVKDFGVLVNRLMAANLSEEALQQVLSAGVDAGSAIATELLGSADGVLRANQLVKEVQTIGDNIGLNAAGNFKQAGVDAGTALVAGITEVISKYQVRLKSKKLTSKQLQKLQSQFAVDVSFAFAGNGLPELANGAVVGSRTAAIIGERGPEAVIPISRPARALQLMEQTGLASLARGSGAAVNIESATFVAPIDADFVAQKILVAEKVRSFG